MPCQHRKSGCRGISPHRPLTLTAANDSAFTVIITASEQFFLRLIYLHYAFVVAEWTFLQTVQISLFDLLLLFQLFEQGILFNVRPDHNITLTRS